MLFLFGVVVLGGLSSLGLGVVLKHRRKLQEIKNHHELEMSKSLERQLGN